MEKYWEALECVQIKGKIFLSYGLILTLAISTGSYLPIIWDMEQTDANEKSFKIFFVVFQPLLGLWTSYQGNALPKMIIKLCYCFLQLAM